MYKVESDQTENQQNAATMDSCFELVCSDAQHGAAQQKVARNSCPRLPHFVDSRFGLYRVAMVKECCYPIPFQSIAYALVTRDFFLSRKPIIRPLVIGPLRILHGPLLWNKLPLEIRSRTIQFECHYFKIKVKDIPF